MAVWVLGATLSGFLIEFSSFIHVWGPRLLVSDAEAFEMEILEEPESERLKTVRRRPVFELGVQTSIRAKVDVLEENAPHGGIDARARTIGFDGDRERGVRRGGGEEEPESRD